MILTSKRYRAERHGREYQSFSLTLEVEESRNYVTVELDHLTRWRSAAEYADYLRWAAGEIETLGAK